RWRSWQGAFPACRPARWYGAPGGTSANTWCVAAHRAGPGRADAPMSWRQGAQQREHVLQHQIRRFELRRVAHARKRLAAPLLPGAGLAAQFLAQVGLAVDLVDRLEHAGRVHRHAAVDALVEPVVARQRLDVAVEHETDDLGVAVEHRAARVAADDVAGVD